MFKITDPRLYFTVLALFSFFATVVKVWINPDLGNVVQSEAPKLVVLAPTGDTVAGNPVVVATPVTSETVVSGTAQ